MALFGAAVRFQSDSSSGGDSTSRSLLDRLRERESPAWRELVNLYAPLVYHWCRKAGLADQETADVVQEVFQAVVAHLGRFKKNRPEDTFRGWLRTITRNKVYDHFRRQNQEPDAAGGTGAYLRLMQVADLDDEPAAAEEDELRAEHALFLRALEMIRQDFQPQTWQAFWKMVVDGRTAGEVAAELHMQPGTVRVAKSRVLQRLRQQLGDLLE